MLIASFREPADARAFVALPAKDEALKVLAGWAGGAIKVFHMEQFDDTVNIDAEDWGHTTPFDTCSHSACSSVRAALAQADGPSPKE
jgi:hypothetical protein